VKIGIAGLGLIGGSFARGFTELAGASVLGLDNDESTFLRAKLVNAVSGRLTKENISECDYVIIALYPQGTIDFLKEYAPFIKKDTVVIDCGGVKRRICSECSEIALSHGFKFIGGHPMAGTHFSGFKYSRASMFDKATMVIVPEKNEKLETLQSLKELLFNLAFGFRLNRVDALVEKNRDVFIIRYHYMGFIAFILRKTVSTVFYHPVIKLLHVFPLIISLRKHQLLPMFYLCHSHSIVET